MSVENENQVTTDTQPEPTPAQQPVTPPPAQQAQPASENADDSKEPHWLADRLARAERVARESLLQELGFTNAEDIKTLAAEHQAKLEADMSELEKLQNQINDFKPKAERLTRYEAVIQEMLDTKLGTLSDEQRLIADRNLSRIPEAVDRLSALDDLITVFNAQQPAVQRQAPKTNASEGATQGKSSNDGLTDEDRAMIVKFGLVGKEDQYLRAKKAKGVTDGREL